MPWYGTSNIINAATIGKKINPPITPKKVQIHIIANYFFLYISIFHNSVLL